MKIFRAHHGVMCVAFYVILAALLLTLPIESKENGIAENQKQEPLNIKKRDDNNEEDKSFFHRVKDRIQNALKANEKAERYLKGDASAKVAESASGSRYGFIHAFVASLSVIIVSELGDKTFFIAAIMAMRHSRLIVFSGAVLALATMTVLSAVLGYATTVIPRWFTYYVSSALFAIFGLKMLREGWSMKPDEGLEEYEEVQADLKRRDEEFCKSQAAEQDAETGVLRSPRRSVVYRVVNKVLIESFTLTFLAEWGDRSQIATIILAARDDVVGVIVGGTIGHALCTGLAVLGGRFIAQRISVRTVTLCGGVIFLLFAVSALVIGPESNS